MMVIRPSLAAGIALALLSACNAPQQAAAPKFDGIARDEVIRFTGTEPFWGGRVEGTMLTYSTPENIDGETFTVKRFAGNHGLGVSGTLGSAAFDMTVTPGKCSDGMSDRVYPFTVTLSIGGELREGCGWTDRQPFTGSESP